MGCVVIPPYPRTLLTRVRLHQRVERAERLRGGDEVAALVQRLDLVMLDVVLPRLLPILDAQRESVRVVLAVAEQVRAAGVQLEHQELLRLLARHLAEEPAGKQREVRIKCEANYPECWMLAPDSLKKTYHRLLSNFESWTLTPGVCPLKRCLKKV